MWLIHKGHTSKTWSITWRWVFTPNEAFWHILHFITHIEAELTMVSVYETRWAIKNVKDRYLHRNCMPQYLNVMVKGTIWKNTCCGRSQAYNVWDFLTQYSIMQIVLKITMYGDIKMSCHKICFIVKIQDGNMFKLRSNINIRNHWANDIHFSANICQHILSKMFCNILMVISFYHTYYLFQRYNNEHLVA